MKKYETVIDLNNKNNSHTLAYDLIEKAKQKNALDLPRVLEVGCSLGYFSSLLRENGFYVYGVELSTDQALKSGCVDDFFYGTVEAFLEEHGEELISCFDFVVMGDVLEHLMEPKTVLARLSGLLTKEGAFILSVPNVTHKSIVAMLGDGQWKYQNFGILDSTHLRFFSRWSLRQLLLDFGFGVEQLCTTQMPILAEYPQGSSNLMTSALGVDADVYQFVLSASRQAFQEKTFKTPPKKIWAISPDSSERGCTWFRFYLPLGNYCKKVGAELRCRDTFDEDDFRWADVLITHREPTPASLAASRMAMMVGMPVVYDLDDMLYDMPSWLLACTTSEASLSINRLISLSDHVVTTTPRFAEELGRYNPKVTVSPNCLSFEGHKDPVCQHGEGPVSIIVASSDTVAVDMIMEPIELLMQAFPDLSLIVVGPIQEKFKQRGFAAEYHSVLLPEDFDHLLESRDNLIGLLPLDRSKFSSMKSPIKYVSYVRNGVVPICSSVPPYSDIIKNGVNGCLAENSSESWYSSLTQVVESYEFRRQILKQALLYCRENFDANVAVDKWTEVFTGLPRSDKELQKNIPISKFIGSNINFESKSYRQCVLLVGVYQRLRLKFSKLFQKIKQLFC